MADDPVVPTVESKVGIGAPTYIAPHSFAVPGIPTFASERLDQSHLGEGESTITGGLPRDKRRHLGEGEATITPRDNEGSIVVEAVLGNGIPPEARPTDDAPAPPAFPLNPDGDSRDGEKQ